MRTALNPSASTGDVAVRGPVVDLDDEAIAHYLPLIRRVLGFRRIPAYDVDDLAQHVIVTAWLHLREGRFQPRPDVPLEVSLRRWVVGIAWRASGRYFERARRRVEVPSSASDFALEASTPEEDAMTGAIARVLRRLPRSYRDVLALVAVGATTAEIASALNLPVSTVTHRIRLGREAFKRALTRWRRW